MKTRILLLVTACLFALAATSQAGGRCGGWYGGRGGYRGGGWGGCGWGGGSAWGWGGGPAWGWGGWGPSFGLTVMAPSPIYRTVYVSETVPVRNGYPRSLVAQTQVRLTRLGYYNSSIDGDFGPKTSRAIQHYQVESGLPVTGFLDRRTLSSLGVAS